MLSKVRPLLFAGFISCVVIAPSLAQETAHRVGVSPTAPAGADPGFYSELMRAIGEQAGFEIEVVAMPLGEIMPALVAGTIDIAAGGGADTEANRALGLAFTTPIALTTGAFIVRGDNTTAAYATLGDLQGVAVGATANTQWNTQLTDAGLTVQTYPNFAAAMTALENGEIAAYYTNPTVFTYQQEQGLHGWARMVDTYTYTDFPPTALGVRSADTELLEQLNEALETLREDGTLAELAEEWHHDVPEAE